MNDYPVVRIKRTPYGRIKIYSGLGFEFVLTSDVYELAHKFAIQHNWTENEIKTIGATYPFWGYGSKESVRLLKIKRLKKNETIYTESIEYINEDNELDSQYVFGWKVDNYDWFLSCSLSHALFSFRRIG